MLAEHPFSIFLMCHIDDAEKEEKKVYMLASTGRSSDGGRTAAGATVIQPENVSSLIENQQWCHLR